LIKRIKNHFYLEVFNPTHDWKLLGAIATVFIPDEVDVFCIHFKRPDVHFYIKGLGYPINAELLHMLSLGDIEYIIIPEDGKRGFKTYLVETKAYLNGNIIKEPLTEEQRCIPLKQCTVVDCFNKEQIKSFLYAAGG
jgi:hypothetical protein